MAMFANLTISFYTISKKALRSFQKFNSRQNEKMKVRNLNQGFFMKSGVKFLENGRCHEIEFFGNGIIKAQLKIKSLQKSFFKGKLLAGGKTSRFFV